MAAAQPMMARDKAEAPQELHRDELRRPRRVHSGGRSAEPARQPHGQRQRQDEGVGEPERPEAQHGLAEERPVKV